MEQLQLAIRSTKLLFSAACMNSLIEDLYYSLIKVSEDSSEELYKRKGSGFWANEIIKGFVAFETLRVYCNENNIGDTKRPLELKTMMIAKDVQKAYRKLGIDMDRTLIFGDSLKRPWRLTFDREYISSRMGNINEFTSDVVKSSIDLVKPPFSEQEVEHLINLINIHLGRYNGDQEGEIEDESFDRIYELSDFVDIGTCNGNSLKSHEKEEYGLWTKETGDWNWSECPLGALPWD